MSWAQKAAARQSGDPNYSWPAKVPQATFAILLIKFREHKTLEYVPARLCSYSARVIWNSNLISER